MKNNKGLVASLVAIIVLLLLTLAVSVVYNFIGGFYSSRISAFNKILGEEQTVRINKNGAYVVSLNFAGTLVLNADIKQKIIIVNGNNDLYLRAKVSLCEKDNCGKMFGYTNWVESRDGYIYLNQPILSNQTIGLCEYVRFDSGEFKLDSNLNYIVSFVIEASVVPYDTLIL